MSEKLVHVRRLQPFGIELAGDLSVALDLEEQQAFREIFYRETLIVLRNQQLCESDQVRVMGYIGDVLGSEGEYREISSDGNLGAGPLCYHSDLSFTPEPFKALSLQALEVVDDQTWTRFSNGINALQCVRADLRERIEDMSAVALISLVQSHREVAYSGPPYLPQVERPAIIAHPVTGQSILYVSEMQTARIGDLEPAESESLLQELFRYLYAPENVYEHRWRNGDLVIWDNLALQHSRPDLTGCVPRRLQRVAVADKSFFELCPQFDLGDPRISDWASGQSLKVDAVA
jgi:taurine dioxygenase